MPFAIEFKFDRNEDLFWLLAFAVLVIGALVGMTHIGREVTPMEAGSPRLLEWSDWRLLQAQRAYASELAVLRTDAMQLSQALDQQPDPVAAQFLLERVARHTKDGDASLAGARTALANAALNVRDWSAGTLDRDAAILSVQDAFALLQQ